MKRTVTVVAAASGAAADVRLDAAVTLADALPELIRVTGSTASSLTREGVALDPRLPVAHLHDGDVVVLGPPAAPPPPAAVVQLDVTAGPDAGQLVALPPGRWVLGCEGSGGLVVSDPRVSGRHLEITIGIGGDVTITDVDSRSRST